MGVPTSEVGYTPAMPRREDHEVHKGHVVALGGKKIVYVDKHFSKSTLHFCCKRKKVKCILVQTLRLCTGRTAHGGRRGIALLFLDHGTRRVEWSASLPGRTILRGKTRYPLYRRLGGPQGRSGHARKISPPRGFDPGPFSP